MTFNATFLDYTPADVNDTLCWLTLEGHYALSQVISLNDTDYVFDWAYQPSGADDFTGVNITANETLYDWWAFDFSTGASNATNFTNMDFKVVNAAAWTQEPLGATLQCEVPGGVDLPSIFSCADNDCGAANFTSANATPAVNATYCWQTKEGNYAKSQATALNGTSHLFDWAYQSSGEDNFTDVNTTIDELLVTLDGFDFSTGDVNATNYTNMDFRVVHA